LTFEERGRRERKIEKRTQKPCTKMDLFGEIDKRVLKKFDMTA
jgi:hypothetical protein